MSSIGIGTLRVPLLSNQTATTAVCEPVYCLGYKEIGIYITGTGTITGGVITIETAYWNPVTGTPYTGTWSSIATVNATDVSGGAQEHVALTDSAYAWVRTRISTTVTGTVPLISTSLVAT